MINIPHRPFTRERITGMMLPDGIFETSLGQQDLVAAAVNDSATTPVQVFVESTSHPAFTVESTFVSCG